MNKLFILFLFASASLAAWEDHPDRDEDRRNEAANSQNYVESGYDWSKRDPDSRDNDSNSSRNSEPGTIGPPDRDK